MFEQMLEKFSRGDYTGSLEDLQYMVDAIDSQKEQKCFPDQDVRTFLRDRKTRKLLQLDFDNLKINLTNDIDAATFMEMPKGYAEYVTKELAEKVINNIDKSNITEDDPYIKFLIDFVSIDSYSVIKIPPENPKKSGRLYAIEMAISSTLSGKVYDFDKKIIQECIDAGDDFDPTLVKVYPEKEDNANDEIRNYIEDNKLRYSLTDRYIYDKKDYYFLVPFSNKSDATMFVMTCDLGANVAVYDYKDWRVDLIKILKRINSSNMADIASVEYMEANCKEAINPTTIQYDYMKYSMR